MIKCILDFILKNKKILQGSLSAFLLAIVIWRSNPRELLLAMQDAPLLYLMPWMAFCFVITVLSWSFGIYCLLARMRRPGGLGQLIAASFKLQVLATITPGRIGDLGLLYFLKDRYTLGQLSSVILVDKLITFIVNIILTVLGIGVFFSWSHARILILFFLVCFLALFWLVFKCPQSFFQWGIFRTIIEKLQGFRFEMRSTVADFKGISINLLLTIFRYLFAGISLALMLFWFDVKVPLFKVILIQAVSQLASFLPLTIMGIGVQEALHVYLFGIINIAPGIILAVMLWGRAIYIFIILSICIYWILFKSANPNVT